MPVTRKQLVYPLPSQSSELLPFLCTFNLLLLSQSPLWLPVAQIYQPNGFQEHLWEFLALETLVHIPCKRGPAF